MHDLILMQLSLSLCVSSIYANNEMPISMLILFIMQSIKLYKLSHSA